MKFFFRRRTRVSAPPSRLQGLCDQHLCSATAGAALACMQSCNLMNSDLFAINLRCFPPSTKCTVSGPALHLISFRRQSLLSHLTMFALVASREAAAACLRMCMHMRALVPRLGPGRACTCVECAACTCLPSLTSSVHPTRQLLASSFHC